LDLSRVEIVLVRPSRPANVAASCRAMKNMGLRALCLVDPPEGLDDPGARALAYGAWDVLDGARRAASLPEAVTASVVVVGTTGREVPGARTPRRMAAEVGAGRGTTSLVFGPEASGLTGVEMDLCHFLVHVPTDPDHPSLNLAQAVLLLAYEMRLATLERSAPPADEGDREARAPAGDVEQAVRDLRAALLDVGYLDPASPDRVLTELRRLIARGEPTPREVVLLRGLARQVSWAGRVARGVAGPDNPRGSAA
jgi:TrmH family RNA methyltransferase